MFILLLCFDGNLMRERLQDNGGLFIHATGGGAYEGGESAVFNFDDSLAVFTLLIIAMVLEHPRQWFPVRAGMGINHPDVEEGLLVVDPETIGSDVSTHRRQGWLSYF